MNSIIAIIRSFQINSLFLLKVNLSKMYPNKTSVFSSSSPLKIGEITSVQHSKMD